MSSELNQQITNALQWRYATKQFDATKKIREQDWKVIQASLTQAPSSYGLQPWKFLIIQNPEIRQKLREVSWNQGQVTDSSHYVVLTYKAKMDEQHVTKFIERTAAVRGANPETLEGYKNMMIGDLVNGPRSQVIEAWAQRQTYIAMGFAMETAALLNVDTCALEGLDPQAYDKILNLEGTGYKTVAALAFGYRHADDKYQSAKKVRFEDKDVVQVI